MQLVRSGRTPRPAARMRRTTLTMDNQTNDTTADGHASTLAGAPGSASEEMTIEDTQELFDFLTGQSLPDGFRIMHRPKLTAKKAFSVIYVLQERFGLIPDHYEQCCECGHLFDTECEGHWHAKTGRHWCGSCEHLAPDESNTAVRRAEDNA
jgi:hypothetical protein